MYKKLMFHRISIKDKIKNNKNNRLIFLLFYDLTIMMNEYFSKIYIFFTKELILYYKIIIVYSMNCEAMVRIER